MKKFAPLFLASLFALTGCASHYVLTLNNGTQLDARGKPRYQNGAYFYTDATGRKTSIPASRVLEVAPASMAKKSKGPFIPEPSHQ